MAIKKRRPQVDPAAIEAFGAAADQPSLDSITEPAAEAVAAPTTPTTPTPQSTTSDGWPEGVPRTHLVRWPDPDLALLLVEVAALEERSQQKTALRALRRGLAAIRADHGA
ncbi:hypothetical protein NS220_11165 [Microbacterium testaceum]|uniref:Uncharacterized protein n=1 Tax=Microbacterium testaceum TaxID=2033 RepID=A0A147EWM4_MICTE|nr:hypothetical protein [Microbacterium testaceum]KTR93796.1 hypothetical protein NS220_11165 [Microbacterium testaceum]